MHVIGYAEDGSIRAIFDDLEVWVPDTLGNRHRRAVAEWEALGNTIPPYVPPQVGFKPIPKYDFWRSVDVNLHLTKDQVLEAIATSDMDEREKYRARLGITDAQTYIRDDPNVVSLLSLMGFQTHEADAFWLWAQPA